MADREEFQKKLAELLGKAAAQGNRMTQEELAAFFRDENLTEEQMVQKVSDLDETIRNMKEEYGRKVSVDEVADRMQISEDDVADIMKLAGEEIKDEEE